MGNIIFLFIYRHYLTSMDGGDNNHIIVIKK